jgi:hypothetical protein
MLATDRPLPGVPPVGSRRSPDVYVHLGRAPRWGTEPGLPIHTADHVDVHGKPVVRISSGSHGFRFNYADDTVVWLDANGRHVWCTWRLESTIEDAATYISGPVLAFLLRLRGALALHASAVQIGNIAIALVGPHGAGKSTTAAALGIRGFPIVTDDVLHLRRDRNHWLVEPFGGFLRLWPEAEHLVLETDALPRICPTWNKRGLRIGEHGTRLADHPVRLGAIAFLRPHEQFVGPQLVPLSAADALIHLTANTSASQLLDTRQRAAEFVDLTHIVRHVPAIIAISDPDPQKFGLFIGGVAEWARSIDLVTTRK